MLEINPTSQRGPKAVESSRNGNKAVVGTAS